MKLAHAQLRALLSLDTRGAGWVGGAIMAGNSVMHGPFSKRMPTCVFYVCCGRGVGTLDSPHPSVKGDGQVAHVKTGAGSCDSEWCDDA